MSAPTLTFTPAPGSPWRVLPDADPNLDHADDGRLVFLEPARNQPARKAHKLIQRGDGTQELKTDGYGKAWEFRHCSEPVADVDDLFAALQKHAPLNQFAVRGQLRSGAGSTINRRLAGDDADILDVGSRVIPVDLDCEVAPEGLDASDIMAVGEYLRGRMPVELRDVSCVIQLSAGYGLGKWKIGPTILKARLWFVNDAALDSPALRRWFKAANASGDCAVMDGAVATANQPIYTAAPLFSGMSDPVPVRLALLYGEADTASIRPPAAPVPVVYAPGAIGERCPDRLKSLVAAIQRTAESGQPRHPVINNAAFTAGRLVDGGAFTADEARDALLPAALATGSDGAERAIHDGLTAGMNCGSPILVGGQRITDLSALPTAWQPEPAPTVSIDVAESKIAAIIQDVIANPRDVDNKLRVAVIRSTVGVGKTEVAIRALVNQHKTLWFAPTHELGDETEDRFQRNEPPRQTVLARAMPMPARAMRGRGAKQRGGGENDWMCAKPAALKAIKDAGLTQHTKPLLCKTKVAVCEHLQAGQCAYYRQMHSQSPARIVAHSYLTTPLAEALGDWTDSAALAVIDENPLGALSRQSKWADVEDRRKANPLSPWFLNPLSRAVAGSILDGVPIPPDQQKTLLEAVQAELAALENEVPAVAPWMSDDESAAALAGFTPKADPDSLSILLACERYLSGAVNSLWRGEIDKKPALFSSWIAPPRSVSLLPVVVLDATANQEMYAAIFARLDRTVEFHEINVAISPELEVTQITDQTFYKRKLTEGLPAKKMAARLAGFIALNGGNDRVANSVGVLQSPVGFVSNKKVVEAVQAKAGCEALHFGDLNGRDTLRDSEVLVIAGRTEPGAEDAEATARALWPTETLNLGGGLIPARTFYTMRDGSRVDAVVRTHADPRVDACVRFVREEALIQAVGRGRYVRSTGKRRLIVFTSVPIPGLIVDRLATTDELLPDWRLAEALLAGHGTALLSANWLAENCPEAFESIRAADRWITYFKPPKPGNRDIYPEMGVSKLTEVTYFLDGQRGGKRRRAITTAQDLKAAAAAISALAGAPVRSIRWTKEEAQEAQPEAAAAPGESVILCEAVPVEVTAPVETTAAPPPAPIFETAVMPELNPSTDPVVVTPPGVGNIRWWLGCAFDADWETPMAPHFGMECETRFTDWRVWFADGNATTVREPEPKTAAEFWGWASGLTGAKQAAPIRGVAV